MGDMPASTRGATGGWLRRLKLLSGATVSLALAGCYVLQAARGQASILMKREPIDRVVARTKTPADVRARLEQAIAIREFASRELGLPRNKSYTTYADIGRDYVVWNVFAAPEFSVDPKLWCFPVAGCVPYRGYFSEKSARSFAEKLRGRGLDVHVGGATAYSTLGHFSDPVLSSMVRYGDVNLASVIFHELAHQRVYVPDDSSFNEAFATAVEQEGVRRWLSAGNRPLDLERFNARRSHLVIVNAGLVETRSELREAYKRVDGTPAAAETVRAAKRQAFAALAERLGQLSVDWKDGIDYRDWFARDLNNARLAAVATYFDCVPGFERLLAASGGDLESFYRRVGELAKQPAAERRSALCRD
ncbi:MAG TPA: aminopeptidase [Steroidobacteraceae bacterium]|nr:aminopeptidase [Steroidobacteraceae bacterium]